MYRSLGAISATAGQQMEIPCVNVTWRSEKLPREPGFNDSIYGCGKSGTDCQHTTPVCSSHYNTPHTTNAQQQMLRDLGFNAGRIGAELTKFLPAWDAYSKARGLPVPSSGAKLGEQHMRMLISDYAGKWGVPAKEGAMPTYTYVHSSGATVQAKNSIEAAQKFKNMGLAPSGSAAAATAVSTGVINQYKGKQQGGPGVAAPAPETGSGVLAAAASLTGLSPKTLLIGAGVLGVVGLGYLATRRKAA